MKGETVGIVGVGLMGHGIASNIQKQGWKIAYLQHPGNQPTEDLITAGATEYQTLTQLGGSCDTIILCVTGSPQVESVLTGDDGLLAAMRKNTVIIDCSTAIPSSTRQLAGQVERAGGKFLDAPMTRTPKEAAEGRLNLIVGGSKELFDQQLPLLNAFAENIIHTGDVGSGHTMKLLHNYVSLGYSTVLAEAAAAAIKSGVDVTVFHEVLAKGGGAGVVLDRMAPFIIEKDAQGLAFTLSNSAKDLGYYTEMCTDLKAAQTVASAVCQTLEDQVDAGNGDAFVPHLIDFL